MYWIIIFSFLLPFTAGQSCTLPDSLLGSWTTTNFGAVNISSGSPSMTTELTLSGLTGTLSFECVDVDTTKYIFRSVSTILVFSGTQSVYAYICMDITAASAYTNYYYLRSPTEVGFAGLRMVGNTQSNLNASDVCTDSTLGDMEFHTMVKLGNENDAIGAVRCPDNLLGQYSYTYTDSTGTYCANTNTAKINTCNDANLTTIQVNNTGCTEKDPFFSSSGVLGCLLSVYSSSSETYYTSLYNLDTTISEPTTYRFICVASKMNTTSEANGTVYVSMIHTDCATGQVATTLPTNGALMVLTPDFTCKYNGFCRGCWFLSGNSFVLLEFMDESNVLVSTGVPTDVSDDTSYLWLIPVLIVIALFIILLIVGICLFSRHKRFLKEKAREKKILVHDEHPLAEMSISLDAPASLDRSNLPIEENGRPLTYRTPRSKRRSELNNPMSESSLHLDFKSRSFYSSKDGPIDPFTEMDNGMIVPMGHLSSRAAKSMDNKRQRSFIMNGKAKSILNGHAGQPLPITDGRESFPDLENPDMMETLTARSVKSMKTVYSAKAPSITARSTKARSIKAPSMKAPSVAVPSVKALSMRAPSTKAPTLRSSYTAGTKSKPKKLTRSLTTTRLGSITKRLTSPRKKTAFNRSSTVILPPKDNADPKGDMSEFVNGEMAITKAPSEAGKSRYSTRTKASRATTARTPRQKGKATIGTADHMTDEDKINAMTRANSMLIRGTINPNDVRRESFFNHQNMSRTVQKPHASKKPWRG